MKDIAVQGLLTGYKTTRDGGLRLQIDLDELQAANFHDGFNGINITVAVARLSDEQSTDSGTRA